MIVLLVISLFTSREILKYLGIEDYGIYNVVAGVVSFVSFFNATLMNSTQRFFNVALGSEKRNINESFKASLFAHSLLAVVLLIAMETIGLWFVQNKLTIPEERMTAALWAFHTSIIITVLQIIRDPFNALIISYEKMSVFAYITIVEAIFKLLTVYCLAVFTIDKLIVYSVLSLVFLIIIFLAYVLYVIKKLPKLDLHCDMDYDLLKDMGKFIVWSSYGGISIMGYTQGLNMLLNIFFGPAVNAARGIAIQIQGILAQFRNNFQVAVNPQLVQSYAEKNYARFLSLLSFSCRFSTFIMLAMSVPLLFRVDWLLELWLVEVPEYTSAFLKLVLLVCIIDSSAGPFVMGIQAHGKIKIHELVTGTLQLLVLPIAYVFLKLGYSPISSFIVLLVFTTLSHCSRLLIFVKQLRVNPHVLWDIYSRILFVAAISVLIGWVMNYILPTNIWFNLVFCGVTFIVVVVLSFLVGLKPHEKVKILNYIYTKLHIKMINFK